MRANEGADDGHCSWARDVAQRNMRKTRFVEVGGWRTLERVWDGEVRAVFMGPARMRIKVRHGNGWWCGRDSQQQTLDGLHPKELTVGGRASLLCARLQVAVLRSTEVTYEVYWSGGEQAGGSR